MFGRFFCYLFVGQFICVLDIVGKELNKGVFSSFPAVSPLNLYPNTNQPPKRS